MLFDIELEKNESPTEPGNITYLQLYYEENEMRNFKELCKKGMVKMWPDDFGNRNISEYIYALVKTASDGK